MSILKREMSTNNPTESPQIKYWFEIYNINNQCRFAHFSSLYQRIDTEICLASECNSLEDNYIYRLVSLKYVQLMLQGYNYFVLFSDNEENLNKYATKAYNAMTGLNNKEICFGQKIA